MLKPASEGVGASDLPHARIQRERLALLDADGGEQAAQLRMRPIFLFMPER